MKKKFAFLVSGNGTTMQTILEGIFAHTINATPSVVISTNNKAYALTRAKEAGIDNFVFPLKLYPSPIDRDLDMLKTLKSYDIDYIFLVGFLGIVSAPILAEFPFKIINIHPALLPSHGGKGYFGINVHQKVLELREPFTGATTHFVDEGVDTGAIILQKKWQILEEKTPQELQKNVLNFCEYPLIFETARLLSQDKIFVQNGRAIIDKSEHDYLSNQGFIFKE